MPTHVEIREVGPRDGFRTNPKPSPRRQDRLINRLARTGLKRIEVASFVRPDVIPQLSDGVEVLRESTCPTHLADRCSTQQQGIDNGTQGARNLREVAIFVSASETHNKKNVNRTIAESMADNEISRNALSRKTCGAPPSRHLVRCPFEAECR